MEIRKTSQAHTKVLEVTAVELTEGPGDPCDAGVRKRSLLGVNVMHFIVTQMSAVGPPPFSFTL